MKKTGVVLLVLGIGVGGAMMFRKPIPQTHAVAGASSKGEKDSRDRARVAIGPIQGVPIRPQQRSAETSQGVQSKPQKPRILNPATRPPLPQLSEFNSPSSSPSQAPGNSRRGRGGQVAKKQPENSQLRYHQIVNGDTLARIARRYLGDATRGDVILRWNREIIRDPNKLPLGEKIRIPSVADLAAEPPLATNRRGAGSQNPPARLVPLPRSGNANEG